MRCLTCQKFSWIKSYNIKHTKKSFPFCNFVKKSLKIYNSKSGHFMTLSGHFFANYIKIFQKTVVQTVILRCIAGLNLNWIKSYGILIVIMIFFHACQKVVIKAQGHITFGLIFDASDVTIIITLMLYTG